jgi:hypothetical protein
MHRQAMKHFARQITLENSGNVPFEFFRLQMMPNDGLL